MKGCFTLLKVILPFCGRCVKSNLGPLEYAGLWLPHEFVNRFVIWSYQHIAYASSTDGKHVMSHGRMSHGVRWSC